jgi:hypothetical protein
MVIIKAKVLIRIVGVGHTAKIYDKIGQSSLCFTLKLNFKQYHIRNYQLIKHIIRKRIDKTFIVL